jgi:hypothetical protein
VEFQGRAKELAAAWVLFVAGAGTWAKRLPHGVLVLQLEQLFSVSAMGSAAATGQDVARQVPANKRTLPGHTSSVCLQRTA